MPEPRDNPLRLLPPIGLALFAIAFFAVILTSGPGEEDTRSGRSAERPTTAPGAKAERRKVRATYTVKRGDTLAGIAERTGIPIEKLQELNPQLDPQSLVSGQKIKLRE